MMNFDQDEWIKLVLASCVEQVENASDTFVWKIADQVMSHVEKLHYGAIRVVLIFRALHVQKLCEDGTLHAN